MHRQKSRRFLNKTVIIAIAAATVLASVPILAKSSFVSSPKPAASIAQATTTGTIVDIASADKSLSTLVTAVKAADLVETLSGKGPFTVFAPTNDAFAALPKGTLEELLKPENKHELQEILTYHVVSGAIDSKSLKSGPLKTVEGEEVNVKVENGQVTVNGAKVITADIKASNGVIHVIDGVLHPPDVEL